MGAGADPAGDALVGRAFCAGACGAAAFAGAAAAFAAGCAGTDCGASGLLAGSLENVLDRKLFSWLNIFSLFSRQSAKPRCLRR